jgi:16S rRNA (cytosine1402-N4)-methyltransferase
MQLDEAARGFSFDGPLDMRMGGEGPSAADVVAHADGAILPGSRLGESACARPWRGRSAACSAAPIETTRALADIVSPVVHAPGMIHPATRTFHHCVSSTRD